MTEKTSMLPPSSSAYRMFQTLKIGLVILLLVLLAACKASVDETPAPVLPPAPASVWVEDYGPTYVDLRWTPVAEATLYRIYQEENATGSPSFAASAASGSKTYETARTDLLIDGLTPGKRYLFKVASVVDGKESDLGSGTVASNVEVELPTGHTVGGVVSDLAGSGLRLQNIHWRASVGGSETLEPDNGAFAFGKQLGNGSLYVVSVLNQPTGPDQTCTVSNGSGTIQGANVTNVAVRCTVNPPATYSIRGTVSGLSGSGLILQNNGGDDLAVTANGSFSFATPLVDGSAYAVTIKTQPGSPGQICTVSNGSGTLAGGNVTNVSIVCTTNTYTIGGTVSGLVGGGLVLQNNGIQMKTVGAAGAFSFDSPQADGSSYNVTVLTQPIDPAQLCSVSNGSGTVSGANVTGIAVDCVSAYTLGGTVYNLAGSGLVLQNDGGDDLAVSGTGDVGFTFATPLTDGSAYAATVLTQPTSPNQNCVFSDFNDSGTIGGANITDLMLTCQTINYGIGLTLNGLAAGRTITLQLNGDYDLYLDDTANGNPSQFGQTLPDGSAYVVTVSAQPQFQFCEIVNGSGTLAGANVADVVVDCHAQLNDTGIDWCADDATIHDLGGDAFDKDGSCGTVAGTHPGQDAHKGRDAIARNDVVNATNELVKVGAGVAGFDFTRVCNNGDLAGEGTCPSVPVVGNTSTDWGCTLDNVTGLMWEVKPDDPDDLRHRGWTYAWYSTDNTSNGGGVGNAGDNTTCGGSLGNCNTETYVSAINTPGLCGANDWRMPTANELMSILHYGADSAPAIDAGYFPNTMSNAYWTSSVVIYSPPSNYAWQVDFDAGAIWEASKNYDAYVRLVRPVD